MVLPSSFAGRAGGISDISEAMAIETKICGVNSVAALDAAVAGGADMIGLNFYPPSPRYLTPEQAAALARRMPPGLLKVALLVEPDDATLEGILAQVPLDMLQLHGAETPHRTAEIRGRFGLPVMKAVKIAEAGDFKAAEPYLSMADRLLFDAKAPKHMTDALPGGNAVAFDWRLLAGRSWPRPWMLSGGLDPGNLAEAVEISGARAVDVSKSPQKIAAFLETARGL
jgi:phosphoribosylanthranilate isomerase